MPTNRKKIVRHRRAPVSGCIEAYLLYGTAPGPDEEGTFELFILRRDKKKLKAAWEGARERLLTEWVKQSPGTRPHGWWLFDAPRDPEAMKGTAWEGTLPIPRRRIGGKGTAMSEVFPGIIPRYERGIPSSWHTIDEEDPPEYESEAAYLERHGLLTETEKRRLKAAHFEPEPVTIEE